MLPHNHHKELTSVTESIDFLSEQSPFYTESIQYAKHSHKNKSHIPPEERNLIFPRQQQQSSSSNSNWFDQEDTDFDDLFGEQPANEKVMAPSITQQTYIQEDQVFLDGGSCDFDDMDLFTNMIDSTPQQPQLKKAKYDHHSSNHLEASSGSSSTTVAVKQPMNNQDNTLLSILIREQQKQGAEISELKQMVHNLQAQILMHPMYQQQFALYQQHQQQQYQLYLQQNQQQENKQ